MKPITPNPEAPEGSTATAIVVTNPDGSKALQVDTTLPPVSAKVRSVVLTPDQIQNQIDNYVGKLKSNVDRLTMVQSLQDENPAIQEQIDYWTSLKDQ